MCVCVCALPLQRRVKRGEGEGEGEAPEGSISFARAAERIETYPRRGRDPRVTVGLVNGTLRCTPFADSYFVLIVPFLSQQHMAALYARLHGFSLAGQTGLRMYYPAGENPNNLLDDDIPVLHTYLTHFNLISQSLHSSTFRSSNQK